MVRRNGGGQLRFGQTNWVNGRTAQARVKKRVGEQFDASKFDQLVSDDDDCQSSGQKSSSPCELQLKAISG